MLAYQMARRLETSDERRRHRRRPGPAQVRNRGSWASCILQGTFHGPRRKPVEAIHPTWTHREEHL